MRYPRINLLAYTRIVMVVLLSQGFVIDREQPRMQTTGGRYRPLVPEYGFPVGENHRHVLLGLCKEGGLSYGGRGKEVHPGSYYLS